MIKVIAVDDNLSALSIISKYAAKVSWITLVETFTSPLEALAFLNDQPVDVILVDVQMQDISGLEFISLVKEKRLAVQPVFIIVSAFDEYAIKGYDLNICDYLLKPYGFDRFLLALEKARKLCKEESKASARSSQFVRQNSKLLRIDPTAVVFVESSGHTAIVHTVNNTPLIVTETITHMESLLKPHGFRRVHKQFLINCAYIKEIDFPHIRMEHTVLTIPIGKTFRAVVRDLSNNKW